MSAMPSESESDTINGVTIIKCYQGIVIGRYDYAGLTGEEQVLK